MKTFEEALISSARYTADTINLKIRDAQDLANDIVSSEFARDYLAGMIQICVDRWQESETSEEPEPLDVMRNLAFSAFSAGVNVGREMGSTRDMMESDMKMEITIVAKDATTYKMVPMAAIPATNDLLNMRWQDESTPGELVQAHVAGIVVAKTWTTPYAITITLG